MSNKIIFQFDDNLEYQKKAVNSVVELFRGLPKSLDSIYAERIRRSFTEKDPVRNIDIVKGNKLFQNLKKVQLKNGLFTDEKAYNKHERDFTVEMETGTGKTYVYLRTILELHKEYGFKKFIIVVPSVAIRKGVEKSIEQLREHFKRLYNVDLSKYSFIYDSNNLGKVNNFVEENNLSICVMNIQAFNKDSNKIRKDDEYAKNLWRDIKFVRPIVLIDEPQKIEGTANKKSQSLKAIDELEPLFTLRYSATHKNLYNQVYKLDSYEAYKKDLVKKIRVKTINSVISKDFPYIRYTYFTKDYKARIEIFSQEQGQSIRFRSFDVENGFSLYELSGGLPQYKDMFIAEQPHKEKALKIVSVNGDIELKLGESNKKLEDKEIIRIQINLAIANHFKKQFEILEEGKRIKSLTLFFIDEVKKVRDSEASDGRGAYLKIFDEEYLKIVQKYKEKIEKYKNYFPHYEDVNLVREGYFALDKKKKEVEVEYKKENEVKAKSQEDIDRGIELILEKKDELISFNEPLAFIFSHSALREGWDNPNVFTLCTLKNGSSEIAKKQEIGRGLRLPVDVTGNRSLDKNVNELTVIANDSYENFSRMLQEDFNKNINKNEVTSDLLLVTLEKSGIPKIKITSELVDEFKKELIEKRVMDSNNVLLKNGEEDIKEIHFLNETLQEHSIQIAENFVKYMVEKGSNRIEIANGDNEPIVNKRRSFISEKDFENLFEELGTNLSKKAIYKCKIDKEKYIESSIEKINNYISNFDLKQIVELIDSKGNYDDTGKINLEKGIEDKIELSEIEATPKSDFEIANYIMYHTMLPRLAILKIISGLEKEKRKALDIQDVLENVTEILLENLNEMKAEKVFEYEVIDGYVTDTEKIFEVDNKINEEDFENKRRLFQAKKGSRSLSDYYKLDSDGEKEFAEKLENDENVLMFTKLKKGGFVIDTPYGNYSPDWAIIYKNSSENNENNVGIYFIVETKADKKEKDLTTVEKNKIKCGKLHFEAISKEVKFNWVNNYDDFKRKFKKHYK
ncbi:DEAD/DEAH box helicase family protein [Leptotrichia sp. oral taxon 879]|uniref:restriction endonuclease n=1 Tax=Leptotrichia sp. oral taxon 879 TaxID=1227267 RepID=UPI0004047C76|nr:DEAD/DEAH box helicase family protein [Leptotrichia sp. oral taxon 879]